MTDEHAIDLSPTHGVWEGEETLHAGPGVTEAVRIRGRLVVQPTLGERGTSAQYEQRDGDEILLRGHTISVATDDPGGVQLHWFSDRGAPSQIFRGRYEDRVLRVEAKTDDGVQRLEQDWSEDARMRTRMWWVQSTAEPVLIFEADYRRAPGGDFAVGSFGWHDLTVAEAPRLRDFYHEVVGWSVEAISMGDYDDYVMNDTRSVGVAGVCHARGINADIPPVWINYVIVADLTASLERVRALEGRVLTGPKEMSGQGTYAVVEDPAGAAIGLFQPA